MAVLLVIRREMTIPSASICTRQTIPKFRCCIKAIASVAALNNVK